LLIVFCKIDILTLLNIKLINTLSTFRRCQDSRERGNGTDPKHESDILTGSSTPNRCGNPFEKI
jgi:hypothetical protein